MGIRDRINKLLGGAPVSSYDKEAKDDTEPAEPAKYRDDVRDIKEQQSLAEFDELSDFDDSRGKGDYR